MESVGSKIKRRRNQLGLTQAEVAEPEFTRGYLSQVENDLTTPSIHALEVIAAKLALPLSDLIGEKNSPDTTNNPDFREKIRICRRLIHLRKYSEAASLLDTLQAHLEIGNGINGEILQLQGTLAYERKEYDKAVSYFDEATIYLPSDESNLLAETYFYLSDCYKIAGEYDKAIDSGLYGYIIFKKGNIADTLLELKFLYLLTFCHCRRNEYRQGLQYIEKATTLSDETKIYFNYGNLKMLEGLAFTYLKDFERGMISTKKALHFFESANAAVDLVGCLTNLGILYRYTQNYEESIHCLKESLTRARAEQFEWNVQNNLYELAATFYYWGKLDDALFVGEEGLLMTKDTRLRGKILFTLGTIHMDLKNWAEAVTYFRQALDIFEKVDMGRWKAKALTKLANLFHEQGEYQSSHLYNQMAIDLYESLMDIE